MAISISQGLRILVWSSIAGGLLSAKCRRGKRVLPVPVILRCWRDPPIRDEEALYDIIDVIVDIADARNGRCHEN